MGHHLNHSDSITGFLRASGYQSEDRGPWVQSPAWTVRFYVVKMPTTFFFKWPVTCKEWGSTGYDMQEQKLLAAVNVTDILLKLLNPPHKKKMKKRTKVIRAYNPYKINTQSPLFLLPGAYAGLILGFPVAGFVCHYFAWQYIFYISGKYTLQTSML